MQNRGKNREGDVLLAISFSPYSNKVLKLAGNVLESGVPVIVFTDSILSPLGLFTDMCLEVKETESFGFRGVVLTSLNVSHFLWSWNWAIKCNNR